MTLPISFQLPDRSEASLGPGEVHVWRAGLDLAPAALRGLEATLSADELARAESYRFPEDRMHFVARHGLLRLLLGRILGTSPAGVRLTAGANGKPGLVSGSRPPVQFSLSSRGALALYALTPDRRVGVDLEAIRPVDEAEAILRRTFTAAEQQAFAEAKTGQRDRTFLELWTRREAYLKGTGAGLSGMEGPEPGNLPPPGWELISFEPAPGHVAALACEGGIGRLSAWELRPG